MDLWRYVNIIRRRWVFMLVPAVVVLGISLLTAEQSAISPTTYNVGMRFLVAPPPVPDDEAVYDEENRYYQWLTSEYVVNGMADWVNSLAFATLVSEQLAADGIEAPAGAIYGGTQATAIRSRLTVTFNYGDAAALEAIAATAADLIVNQSGRGLPNLRDGGALVTQLDPPVINPVPPPITNQLALPLRLLVAVFAGVAFGFAVEFFDPMVRGREDLPDGLPVLGTGADAFRTARAHLLLHNHTAVVVAPADEKTDGAQAAAHLARALAATGERTVAVEADFRHPRLHQTFNLPPEPGTADFLRHGSAGWENENLPTAVTDAPNLSVVPVGRRGDDLNPADAVYHGRMPELLAAVQPAPTLLVIHAAPFKSGMDAAVLASLVGGVVVPVQVGRTRRADVARVQAVLQRTGGRLLGVLLVDGG